jgi:hypothetical protein
MCDDGVTMSEPALNPTRRCLTCGVAFEARGRSRYHSRACQQQAYRLRHSQGQQALLQALVAQLRERQALVDQTVYECPRCEARYLGHRRCPDCQLMCRKLGLGGSCPHCDDLVLLNDLLGLSPE